MAQSASRVGDFTNSIGVNTHAAFNWTVYGNTSLVEKSLAYLGVGNVRDQLVNTGNAALFQQIHNATGVKFDFSVATNGEAGALIGAIEGLGTGVVNAVEGSNEPDLSGAASAAAQQQVTLYKDIKSSLGVPVIQASFGNVGNYGSTGNQSAYADYGNAHTYFGTGNNPGWAGWIGHMNALAQETTPGKPVVITETGFYTTNNSGDASNISEGAAAKYTLDMLLDAYQQGDVRSYLYELLDTGTGDGNNEDNFGLFHTDGSAKPAATAVHNLMSLLSDKAGNSGSFSTGSLGYSLSGMPSSGNSMLMEKSDGTYWLAVWNDARVAGPGAGQVDTVANTSVTLALDSAASSVSVFDPLTGTSSVASSSNTKSVSLSLPDHPILVEITPGGTVATPVSAPTPAPVTTPTTTPTTTPVTTAPTTPATSGGSVVTEAAGQSSVAVGANTTVNLNGADNTVYLQGTGDTLNGSGGNVSVLAFMGGSHITLAGGNDSVRLAGSGSVVDLKGPQNTVAESGDGNTFVLEPGANDVFLGNVLSKDVFDLRPALASTNWNGSSSTVGHYVQAVSSNNGTSVQLSATANGAAKQIAYLSETGVVSTATILAHSVT